MTRGDNSVSGVRTALSYFEQGQLEMIDNAEDSMNRAPFA
jgi:hypothetical protein